MTIEGEVWVFPSIHVVLTLNPGLVMPNGYFPVILQTPLPTMLGLYYIYHQNRYYRKRKYHCDSACFKVNEEL